MNSSPSVIETDTRPCSHTAEAAGAAAINDEASQNPLQPYPKAPSGLEVDRRLSLYRDMFKAAGAVGADSNDLDVSCHNYISTVVSYSNGEPKI